MSHSTRQRHRTYVNNHLRKNSTIRIQRRFKAYSIIRRMLDRILIPTRSKHSRYHQRRLQIYMIRVSTRLRIRPSRIRITYPNHRMRLFPIAAERSQTFLINTLPDVLQDSTISILTAQHRRPRLMNRSRHICPVARLRFRRSTFSINLRNTLTRVRLHYSLPVYRTLASRSRRFTLTINRPKRITINRVNKQHNSHRLLR